MVRKGGKGVRGSHSGQVTSACGRHRPRVLEVLETRAAPSDSLLGLLGVAFAWGGARPLAESLG
jgi:hypothetical protein